MSGVKLEELDVSDMLDVIHYMFEEDMRIPSAEVAEAVSKSRSVLYRELYGREYQYTVGTNKMFPGEGIDAPLEHDDDDDDITPFNPTWGTRATSRDAKPFIPATDFNPDAANPFGTTLDAPLG
jgi:hypothetical protein